MHADPSLAEAARRAWVGQRIERLEEEKKARVGPLKAKADITRTMLQQTNKYETKIAKKEVRN